MQNRILSIGSTFPAFSKPAVVSIEKGKEFYELHSQEIMESGKWLVMFWW